LLTVGVSAGALSLAICAVVWAKAILVHVQGKLAVNENVHIAFQAQQIPEGGYYYGVIVLRPYKKYTRGSPPPCSTSSNMQRTNYGYPQANGKVALALTPTRSSTRQWCPGGSYEGAIYAVPRPPPCESRYPCSSEEPSKRPCAGVGPGCLPGVVALPKDYAYPDGLPKPRAAGTKIVSRFSVKFRR
jgi:hypothetical protein